MKCDGITSASLVNRHRSIGATMSILVGVDISKKRLDVFILPLEESLHFPNDETGICDFVELVKPQSPALIAFEHSGRMSRALIKILERNDIPSAPVDPRIIRSFARALGIEAKTDKIDAKVIANFAALFQIGPSHHPTEEELNFRELVTRRTQLVAFKKQELNRNHESHFDISLESLSTHIKWLSNEIKSIEKLIRQSIDKNQEWKSKYDIIMSIPGAGNVLSITMLAYLPELGSIDSRRISSLIGLAPVPKESGSMHRRRRIRFGRMHIRNVLYMATITATRNNSILRDFYNRLTNAGKPPLVARTAVMRKLLVIINAMIRDGSIWNPEIRNWGTIESTAEPTSDPPTTEA